MGRAFSEAERAAVQEKLRRTGLELFAKKGIKGVSIRDLTAAAGIAQGGFYAFYRDKSDFLADLIELRTAQKLSAIRDCGEASREDPRRFLGEMLFTEGMRLKRNRAFDNMISDTLAFFCAEEARVSGRVEGLYTAFLKDMEARWRADGLRVTLDVRGFINLVRAAGILITNAALMDDDCFEAIYRRFCQAEAAQFIAMEE